MTEFLLIPKRQITRKIEKPIAVDMSRESREKYLEELKDWSSQVKLSKVTLKAMEEIKHNIGATIKPVNTSLALHGVQLWEADVDALDAIQGAFPNMHVLADEKFKALIPRDDAFSLKVETRLKDWHLVSTGIKKLRNSDSPLYGSGVTIAVLDTGITPVTTLKGRIKAHYIYDFNNGGRIISRSSGGIKNRYWHGTAIADLIAGKNTGIAPKSKLIDVAMIPRDSGTIKQFVKSLYFAISIPDVSIINFSAGLNLSYENDNALQDVLVDVINSGVLPIAAVGNQGQDKAASPGRLEPVVSVGAANPDRTIWENSGSISSSTFSKPDLVTAGSKVYSVTRSGQYKSYAGSSFATAITSGIAALILENQPRLNPMELRQILLDACVSLSAEGNRQGAGFLKFPSGESTLA